MSARVEARSALGNGVLIESIAGTSTAVRVPVQLEIEKRSPVKIMERTHEEATEALYAGRESRHLEAASVGAGSYLRMM